MASKGIVKSTPIITASVHPGRLTVKVIDPDMTEINIGDEVDFVFSDTLSDVDRDDWVEFRLNEVGKPYQVTRKIRPKGIVREETGADDSGRLMVSDIYPNEDGIVINKTNLTFTNKSGVTLREPDLVILQDVTSTHCVVYRKVVPNATIKSIDNEKKEVQVQLREETVDGGVLPDGRMFTFSLPRGPLPFKIKDVVEILILDNDKCLYVDLILSV